MGVFVVISAALVGGLVTALVGSWFNRLSALEVGRLVVFAELKTNLAVHHSLDLLVPDERPSVLYSSNAWFTHRDRLAVRAQRHPDLWSAVSDFYGIVTSLRGFSDPLDGSLEWSLSYAVANFDLLELSTLELVPVYGPLRAYRTWRERRQRSTDVSKSTAE